MVFRRALYFLSRVAPRGIGVNDRILLDNYTPFSPELFTACAARMRSLAAA